MLNIYLKVKVGMVVNLCYFSGKSFIFCFIYVFYVFLLVVLVFCYLFNWFGGKVLDLEIFDIMCIFLLEICFLM